MELHERLNTSKPASGAQDPFAEVKSRVHFTVIGDLGPQLYNVNMDPDCAPRACARGRPRPARPGDGYLARRPSADRARDHRRHPRPRPARAAPRRRIGDRDHGQRPARDLGRAERTDLTERCPVQRRVASAPDHQQDGRPGRPPHRRVVADGRRAPARRQPRQRRDPAALAQRSAHHDPQVQPPPADARRHDQDGHAEPGDGRVPAALYQGAAQHADLGRYGLGKDDASQRAVDRDSERGADRHDRGRGRVATEPGPRAQARVTAEGPCRRQRDPDPCACAQLAPHASRPDHRRRGPRPRGARHAPGNEHRATTAHSRRSTRTPRATHSPASRRWC